MNTPIHDELLIRELLVREFAAHLDNTLDATVADWAAEQ